MRDLIERWGKEDAAIAESSNTTPRKSGDASASSKNKKNKSSLLGNFEQLTDKFAWAKKKKSGEDARRESGDQSESELDKTQSQIADGSCLEKTIQDIIEGKQKGKRGYDSRGVMDRLRLQFVNSWLKCLSELRDLSIELRILEGKKEFDSLFYEEEKQVRAEIRRQLTQLAQGLERLEQELDFQDI